MDKQCEHCGKPFRPWRPSGRFCSRSCLYAAIKGPDNPGWRGGRHVTKDGYVRLYRPGHPKARGHGGYVSEHRVVMEEQIGRMLNERETVHHRNGLRSDNRPENLELWINQPKGQRVDELIDFMVTHYADALRARLTSGG